jgi:hypothetical protein
VKLVIGRSSLRGPVTRYNRLNTGTPCAPLGSGASVTFRASCPTIDDQASNNGKGQGRTFSEQNLRGNNREILRKVCQFASASSAQALP